MATVEARGLHKSFGDVNALRGVSLSVEEGEILGVLGPNGAGKTTTINILTTLLRPDSGTVRVAGIDVLADPAAVRPLIGLTGQFAALDDALTARENLILFGRLFKLGKAAATARAAELLDEFDLTDAADRRTATFSGGMRRRLDLAASMIGKPRVLFLDEPTTGLDPRSRAMLWDVVRHLRDEGITVFLTTQYLEEADQLADRIVVIDHGTVIAEGTPDELKARIGGAVCHLTVDDEQRARAAAVLGVRWPVAENDGELTVPSDGPATLFAVVRVLDENGIVPDDIGLRNPTLDDVFLALTGEPTDADAEANA
ncbi:MAG TPA: ATP-binding cassette domain-containing protein [Gordonia sp. (in: high G+C Gram-positive bacteria)]|uniref:ATP-binding cassette domain-containing protein n=1 Tax=unclassified Gordonia (in: high G+C Gram-positive bacteria) TaxID=2657482 RepID=UPI000FA90D00|nr:MULTISPECIES: ATP-binding cassette domain-containing protein [unclassified Gordonia (in: high G+C Gram-positive bacteria)]RUP39507.1 MAG: ATP-binding cassette domain-containing protein [Gordonia sp. (in: high G+C Gram-positive bacteria)]HNP57584.1 ATP-binding cassette domain-containing protein [Gordonia sp. (in: high G+C Gram-positive bacteria)]HRC49581.1 ATP-binding cassette domain-containing protein [Gordonia sp. (in: high G+C Gram-positive bacteria)]